MHRYISFPSDNVIICFPAVFAIRTNTSRHYQGRVCLLSRKAMAELARTVVALFDTLCNKSRTRSAKRYLSAASCSYYELQCSQATPWSHEIHQTYANWFGVSNRNPQEGRYNHTRTFRRGMVL